MSGTRQHFIPKLLLRGFLDPEFSNREITHVYRKNAPPFRTDIANIGIEGYFYGKPGVDSLDERISLLESQLGNYVSELRRYANYQVADSLKCAALCAHLATRTRHLRLVAHEILDSFIRKLIERYTAPGGREAVVRKLFDGDQKDLKVALKDEFAKHDKLSQLTEEQRAELIERFLSKPEEIMDMFVRGIEAPIPAMLHALRLQMKTTVENAHNKGLHSDTATQEHEKKLGELEWVVLDAGSGLVLGDFVLLGQQDLKPTFTSYLMATEFPLALFLPIASNRVLVGRQKTLKTQDIDVSSLNNHIAANSIEHFVAACEGHENFALSSSIGSGIAQMMIIYEQMMNDLIQTKIIPRPG